MERVDSIGLGTMRKPVALHLLKAGYPLTVLNRSCGPENNLMNAPIANGRCKLDHSAFVGWYDKRSKSGGIALLS